MKVFTDKFKSLDFRNYPVFFIALFLILSLGYLAQIGNRWNATNTDPDYIHLFNTLNVIKGYPPGNIDNPATPTHLLASLIFRAVYSIRKLWRTTDSIVIDVIKNPNLYINATCIFLIVVTSVIVYIFSRLLLKESQKIQRFLMPGTLFLMTPFFTNACSFSAQTLLIIAGLILLFAIYKATFLETPLNNRQTVLLGFGLALGLFSKYTFIHLFPVVLFIGLSKRQYLYLLLSFALFSFIFGYRLIGEQQRIFSWLELNLLHSGQYGYNPGFIPPFETWISNLLFFVKQNIIFSLTLLAVFIKLILRPGEILRNPSIMVLFSCVILFICFMAGHKTYSYYFIVDFMMMPVFLKFILEKPNRVTFISGRINFHPLLKPVLLCLVMITFLAIAQFKINRFYTNKSRTEIFFDTFEKRGISNGAWRGSKSASSFYGNLNSGFNYTSELNEIFGNQTFPNIYSGYWVDFGNHNIREINKGELILVNRFDYNENLKSRFEIKSTEGNFLILSKEKVNNP